MSLSIICNKEEFASQSEITEEELIQILLMNMYDVLSCEKFKFPEYNEIEESVTKTSLNIEFKFIVSDITIL